MTTPYSYIAEHQTRFQQELIEILRIPSVSTDSQYKAEVDRTAAWLADNMRRIGLDHVAIMPTGGHPSVYGDWLYAGADKPTVLIYGHYDVQPAVIEDGWLHPPFEPEIRENRVYARGACDDKGQVLAHLKAVEALLATGGAPVNLKYIIEGEEEIGSPNLTAFVEKHRELLKADVCLISDTGMLGLEKPSMYYALRGLVSFEIIVRGPVRDTHSGYGGIMHNPAQAVAEIIAKLHHEDGRVAVPHFYDEVVILAPEDRAELAKVEMSAAEWHKMAGDLPEWGEAGYLKIERIGTRPTLEINGISGGYAGEGFKTVIGAQARAKISCRLVANQDPDQIYALVCDYIRQITPPTVHLEIVSHGHGKPAYTPIQHPTIQAAKRALERVWGTEAVFVPGGGSIPIVADFQALLGLPVVLLGFSLPDGGAHGPNESFHLTMYQRGIETIITYLHELAAR